MAHNAVKPLPQTPPPRVSINDIPEELLVEIVGVFHSHYNRKTLWSLSLVKQFSRVATAQLYSVIPFGGGKFDWRLLKVLLEKPELGKLVRRVLLCPKPSDVLRSRISSLYLEKGKERELISRMGREDTNSFVCAVLLLLHCPNLTGFHVWFVSGMQPLDGEWILHEGSIEPYWAAAFRQENFLSSWPTTPKYNNLKSIQIHIGNGTMLHDVRMTHIIPLFHLESLHCLKVEGLREQSDRTLWSWSSESLLRKHPSITSLRISRSSISVDTMAIIIDSCKELQKLHFSGDMRGLDPPFPDGTINLLPIFESLKRSQASLTKLELRYTSRSRRQPSKRENIQLIQDALSNFTFLEDVVFDAELVFGTRHQWPKLSAVLPTGLRSFRIAHAWEELVGALFYDAGPLSDVVDESANVFPKLRTIRVGPTRWFPQEYRYLQRKYEKRGISFDRYR